MIGLLTAVHILVAIALILIVLLQSAQGADIAGAFGGMGSQAAFGPRGTTTFLSKATIALAAVFMVTSVTLSLMGGRAAAGSGSLLGDEPAAAQPTAPATPAPPTPGSAAATQPTPAPGAQGVPVDGNGLQGMKANVTVENPDGSVGGAPGASIAFAII